MYIRSFGGTLDREMYGLLDARVVILAVASWIGLTIGRAQYETFHDCDICGKALQTGPPAEARCPHHHPNH
jgi:hypothetical protein